MTRSEWFRRTIHAYWDELCPTCGHPANNFSLDSFGNLYQYCEVCRVERQIAQEHPPASFDPEPYEDQELPF